MGNDKQNKKQQANSRATSTADRKKGTEVENLSVQDIIKNLADPDPKYINSISDHNSAQA